MDIGTIVSWLQVVFWIWAAYGWVKKMIKDEALEMPKVPNTTKVLGVAIAIGMIVSVASLYLSYRPRTVEHIVYKPTPRILIGWGTGSPNVCAQKVDLDPLIQFAATFNVVTICGVTDPSTDKFEDERITVSSARTIIGGQEDIVTPTDPKMGSLIKQMNKVGVKLFSEWNEVILLPKTSATSDIRKLSDVHRYGGKIIGLDQL